MDVEQRNGFPEEFPRLQQEVTQPVGIEGEDTQGENVGELRIQVRASLGFLPIEGATITIFPTQEGETQEEVFQTDNSGETVIIPLKAPAKILSMTPGEERPYGEYTITVTARGYAKVTISGIQILSGEVAEQVVEMTPMELPEEGENNVVIPEHTLYGEYPPKIPEDEIKPMEETGEIVLNRVVIPEYIIVHDGVPSDSSAKNYWVRYKDYIKNVASSEIYATWPEATIYANILVIMSFTMNRVYTEWYRNQGYSFTITSSTAYDQK